MEVTTKICTKCQIEKPINKFHKNGKQGVHSYCKECTKECTKEYYKKNLEQEKEKSREWYKNNTEYYKGYNKEWYRNNAEYCREYNKEYYKNNIEYYREQNNEYYKNNAEYYREYYKNNLENHKKHAKEWRRNNPEKIKELNRRWQINNLEKRSGQQSKRKALIKNSTVENVDLLQLYKNHKWVCGICGLKIDKKLKWPNLNSISHDHIIPISKGGDHTYDNIQPAHLGCNLRKGIKIDNIQLKLQLIS